MSQKSVIGPAPAVLHPFALSLSEGRVEGYERRSAVTHNGTKWDKMEGNLRTGCVPNFVSPTR